jgi:hypothetical protein
VSILISTGVLSDGLSSYESGHRPQDRHPPLLVRAPGALATAYRQLGEVQVVERKPLPKPEKQDSVVLSKEAQAAHQGERQ